MGWSLLVAPIPTAGSDGESDGGRSERVDEFAEPRRLRQVMTERGEFVEQRHALAGIDHRAKEPNLARSQ